MQFRHGHFSSRCLFSQKSSVPKIPGECWELSRLVQKKFPTTWEELFFVEKLPVKTWQIVGLSPRWWERWKLLDWLFPVCRKSINPLHVCNLFEQVKTKLMWIHRKIKKAFGCFDLGSSYSMFIEAWPPAYKKKNSTILSHLCYLYTSLQRTYITDNEENPDSFVSLWDWENVLQINIALVTKQQISSRMILHTRGVLRIRPCVSVTVSNFD